MNFSQLFPHKKIYIYKIYFKNKILKYNKIKKKKKKNKIKKKYIYIYQIKN